MLSCITSVYFTLRSHSRCSKILIHRLIVKNGWSRGNPFTMDSDLFERALLSWVDFVTKIVLICGVPTFQCKLKCLLLRLITQAYFTWFTILCEARADHCQDLSGSQLIISHCHNFVIFLLLGYEYDCKRPCYQEPSFSPGSILLKITRGWIMALTLFPSPWLVADIFRCLRILKLGELFAYLLLP